MPKQQTKTDQTSTYYRPAGQDTITVELPANAEVNVGTEERPLWALLRVEQLNETGGLVALLFAGIRNLTRDARGNVKGATAAPDSSGSIPEQARETADAVWLTAAQRRFDGWSRHGYREGCSGVTLSPFVVQARAALALTWRQRGLAPSDAINGRTLKDLNKMSEAELSAYLGPKGAAKIQAALDAAGGDLL
jgi:hypothetical protein